jgi:ATP-dependent DNA ligase
MARGVARRRRTDAPALSERIAPQLTHLVDAAPEGDGWLPEIKFDEYRMHARLDRGAVRRLTRTGLDWTRKYPPITGPWRRSMRATLISTVSCPAFSPMASPPSA